MPRANRIFTKDFAYHLSARSNNKEWFYISMSQSWDLFVRYLAISAERYGAEIHTFVLMANHFHLIVSTPNANVDDFMRYFLSVSTFAIQRISGRINHVLGARYKSTVLGSAFALAYVYKYVLRNPVRAGICAKVEAYDFSSLNDPCLPTVEGFSNYWRLIPREYGKRLKWLNLPTPKEKEELIGKALRRPEFAFTKDNNFQKALRSLKESYGVEEL